jgi:glycosyltransferase involved in cell wall biosynthesis
VSVRAEPLRVAIDVSARSRPGHDRGHGRYLRSVLEANASLGNDVVELELAFTNGRLSELLPLVPRTVRVRRAHADVFHAVSPYYYAPGIRHQLVTIQDLIPLDVPYGGTGIKTRLLFSWAARRLPILTISEHARTRIIDRLGADPDRVIVAPTPSVLPSPGVHRLELPSRFVAAMVDLRSFDPRKRIEWVEGVAAGLHRHGIGFVVVGPGTREAVDRFQGAIALGRTSDEELSEVLGRARAFVYTSAYEGQGLPPLEAINVGTPVVAMRNTSIPEVVGDAAILIDEDLEPAKAARGPHHRDDPPVRKLVSACVALCEDDVLHQQLVSRCRPQAARFTLDRLAAGLARGYELART